MRWWSFIAAWSCCWTGWTPTVQAQVREMREMRENQYDVRATAHLRENQYDVRATAHRPAYALIVGNNAPPEGEPGRGLSTLRYADDDALRYAELLTRVTVQHRLLAVLDPQTRQRFADETTDGPPTLAAVRAALGELATAMRADLDAGKKPRLYFVFSGHGAVGSDGQAFLALLDGPLTRGVLFEELIAQVPAHDVHLIIDACHAAGVVGVRGGAEVEVGSSPVSTDDVARWAARRSLDRFPHVGVLVATTAGEQAHEWSTYESGVFTHEVLSGLWGPADVNADERIEYSEVQAFAASANRALADPKVRPTIIARPPAIDPHSPLVDLSTLEDSVWLVGDASGLGHFHVELADGRRHLDANLGPGRTRFAVPAGRSAFVRTSSTEARVELQGRRAVRLDALAMVQRSDAARGSTAEAYRRGLFAEQFTPDYYRGFIDSAGAVAVRFEDVVEQRGTRPEREVVVEREPDLPSVPSPRTHSPANTLADDPITPAQRRLRRRKVGYAFVGVSAASTLAAIGTGIAAGLARRDFDGTAIEVEAAGAAERYQRFSAAAIGTGVVAGLTATVATILLVANRDAKR